MRGPPRPVVPAPDMKIVPQIPFDDFHQNMIVTDGGSATSSTTDLASLRLYHAFITPVKSVRHSYSFIEDYGSLIKSRITLACAI